jgi:uncharacterized membrane protein (UPF0127 family)
MVKMKNKNDNFYYILAKYSIYPGIFIMIGLLIFYFYPKPNYNRTKTTYINIAKSIKISNTIANNTRSKEKIQSIYINNIKLKVYLAKTSYEQEVGLMKYYRLPIDKGMLFNFTQNSIHTFWMAFTYIPLDMIFISKNMQIVNIIKAYPCVKNECKVYTTGQKSLYVLELNPHFIINNNIKIGDKVKLF